MHRCATCPVILAAVSIAIPNLNSDDTVTQTRPTAVGGSSRPRRAVLRSRGGRRKATRRGWVEISRPRSPRRPFGPMTSCWHFGGRINHGTTPKRYVGIHHRRQPRVTFCRPGRAGARAGQPPRPLPATRRRLGGPIHQPERHNLGHAGRRRGRNCRHRTRQPGRAAVDDPGAAGPLASAVGPGGTSGTPRFPAAVVRHPTDMATQRGPSLAKDAASQSIWIAAGIVEGEYCSDDVGFWSTWLCRADTQIEHCQMVGIDAYAVAWCAPMKRPAEQWNWPHRSA